MYEISLTKNTIPTLDKGFDPAIHWWNSDWTAGLGGFPWGVKLVILWNKKQKPKATTQRVDNNKTNNAKASRFQHHIPSLHGGVKLETLWKKKAQINSVGSPEGWHAFRVKSKVFIRVLSRNSVFFSEQISVSTSLKQGWWWGNSKRIQTSNLIQSIIIEIAVIFGQHAGAQGRWRLQTAHWGVLGLYREMV